MGTVRQMLGNGVVVSDPAVELSGGGCPNRPRQKEERKDVVGNIHAFASRSYEGLGEMADAISHRPEFRHTRKHPKLFRDEHEEVGVGPRRSRVRLQQGYAVWNQGVRCWMRK